MLKWLSVPKWRTVLFCRCAKVTHRVIMSLCHFDPLPREEVEASEWSNRSKLSSSNTKIEAYQLEDEGEILTVRASRRVEKQPNQQATLAGEATSEATSAVYQKRAEKLTRRIVDSLSRNFMLGIILYTLK